MTTAPGTQFGTYLIVERLGQRDDVTANGKFPNGIEFLINRTIDVARAEPFIVIQNLKR